jgi:hypothetical protein
LFQGDRKRENEYQSLWFSLSRFPWRSLVIVPVDDDGSAAGVATALAGVGKRLRPGPITFLLMTRPIDYPSAEKFVAAVAARTTTSVDSSIVPKVIISVPPVIVEPLALAVTGAADAVVLCIRKGSTRLLDADRTAQLVGRDRVVGCVLR